jgi:glutamate dehydrogenase (NADP+)
MAHETVFDDAVARVERIGKEANVGGEVIDALGPTKGGIYCEKGFDVESVHRHKQETRKLQGTYCEGSVGALVDSRRISNQELLELDVELLVPAALEGVIHSGNADRIRAMVIAEVANGPIAGGVDAKIREREIRVLPDVLTNAGGVVVSYFEWVQNRQGYAWTLDEVRNRLNEVLVRAFGEVWKIHLEEHRSLRDAAYAVALRRIGEAIEMEGTRAYFGGS